MWLNIASASSREGTDTCRLQISEKRVTSTSQFAGVTLHIHTLHQQENIVLCYIILPNIQDIYGVPKVTKDSERLLDDL